MNTNKTPELLAPAGGWEQLEYAIRFGADAVYLAAERFGMRQRASNFKLEEIPRVVEYAHSHGVKVHVTCNIMMHQDDLDVLPSYFEVLDNAGVDAVIVGDLGAICLAKEHAPHVEIHVSTQASVSNALSALTYYELGAKRIVCAREMSLEAIRQLRAQIPADLELEAFVHGSMCMAYSGRCLISDYLTDRSALTGHCTQSCRWNYVLEEEKRPGEYYPVVEDGNGTYIMNAKDLKMLEHLDELAAAGIDSVKIEGRNKKAFYVATVVNAYRQVLDGAPADEFEPELEAISHRPYSTGFFFGPATQAHESDARDQRYEWVAEVLSCEEAGEGLWSADVQLRNAFTLASELQLLSPHRPVVPLQVQEIFFVPSDEFGNTWEAEPVKRANRAMERYRITVGTELFAHDIIRGKKDQQA